MEKQYGESKAKALRLYGDYKNLKKTVKDELAKSNLEKTLSSDSIEKTLIDLLTKSYLLAKSELNLTKEIIVSAADSIAYGLRAAGGMLSYICGGDPIAKTKFESDVKNPIKDLFKCLKKSDEISKGDEDFTEIFNKFKDTQASLEGYVSYTFKKIPDDKALENMPGVQVFLRILLGLAGVERVGKVISNDGTGNGKARANYVFETRTKSYSFGGGLLALVVYNIVYSAYRLSPSFKEMERARNRMNDMIKNMKKEKIDILKKLAEKDE